MLSRYRGGDSLDRRFVSVGTIDEHNAGYLSAVYQSQAVAEKDGAVFANRGRAVGRFRFRPGAIFRTDTRDGDLRLHDVRRGHHPGGDGRLLLETGHSRGRSKLDSRRHDGNIDMGDIRPARRHTDSLSGAGIIAVLFDWS